MTSVTHSVKIKAQRLFSSLSGEMKTSLLWTSTYLLKNLYMRLVVACVKVLLLPVCFKHDIVQYPKAAVFSHCLMDWIS